ncbi:serine/threonine-protein kinase [Pseudomonas entomophila]|uniref:leucine-rich repeat-containing protein kinase family protein n=1 Tax=Pseudomonas entomophila TaxID=312306 RepID=UPI0015E4521A|nr:leucine-rich repeat-containing protein kinase family protein [Pseudomonas entomophila]MBA1187632.1 serine/threonine-protein kinase [Pseudomonas entomophila]
MHTLDDLKAGRLHGLTRLDLSQGLDEFPQEIFSLADSLEVLNLSGNRLSRLPHDMHRLHRLRVLFCSDNLFTDIPVAVGQCQRLETVGFRNNRIERIDGRALPPALRALILTENALEHLPDTLGDCAHLQKLMLSGNRLTDLPQTLARCDRLELLRLASNRLTTLPRWLLDLPRLAWLAFSGNPCEAEPLADLHPCPSVSWDRVAVKEILGRGASGVIHRAHLDGEPGAVAVKLFKGALTSDGAPLAEVRACLAAGQHPGLTGLLGRIDDHPTGLPALIMPLLAPTWFNLAGPPSLDSCTRDRYPERLPWRLPALRRLARTVALAGAHLHAHGLNHGDLYAHNILCDDEGDGVLGDFGAAAFSPRDLASGLERIEVRAFGLLLDELLERADGEACDLRQLAQDCQQPAVASRPSFAQVAARL